ncbi:transmembrane transporter [Bisporella sp. PMI_857]|nr:transmembrane transporter [Bisporella sp. PMI_857]
MDSLPDKDQTAQTIENSILPVFIPDPVAERKLLWKVDFRVVPLLYVLLILMQIDRTNIGNVRIQGILEELHMVGNDFNVAILIYTVPFMLFELPSSLMLRRFRPGACIWVYYIGMCTVGAGLTRSYGGLLACRFLVGSFEAGFTPCCAYLISQYYKRHEFQKRYSIFFSATQVGGAFGGFLSYALAKLNNKGGYAGWRWIFIIEGILTVCLSAVAYFFTVPLPENSKFLGEDQKTLLLNRLSHDESEIGADADTTPLKFRQVLKIAFHWKVILAFFAYVAADINAASINAFQPTILRSTGYTSSQAQVRTIPVYMTAMVANLTCAYCSDRYKLRYPFLMVGAVSSLLGWSLELGAVPIINHKTGLGAPGMRYAGMFCIAIGAFVQIPILVVWLGNNLRGRKERVVGLAVLISGGQAGNLVAANMFLTEQEKDGFQAGFATGLGFAALGVLAATILAVGLWWENKCLDKKDREALENGVVVEGGAVRFRNTL